ncbi:MAG: PfkB family carbohydrate kinase [Proteobacteria bacterium]|nr:PfkB family carbohydrate kinase [Pseudomonadota bacterium]
MRLGRPSGYPSGPARRAGGYRRVRHPCATQRGRRSSDHLCAFAGWLGTAPTAQAVQAALLADCAIRSVGVTEGEHGARLWHEGSYVVQPAYPATVVDTIGAGDAFIAMLLTELLRGASPTAAMNRAARLAAYVVSCAGALPDYDAEHFAR